MLFEEDIYITTSQGGELHEDLHALLRTKPVSEVGIELNPTVTLSDHRALYATWNKMPLQLVLSGAAHHIYGFIKARFMIYNICITIDVIWEP